MEKISVVIITKNEAEDIKDCLESVKELNEIIVIDCGSTDDTVKIAKKYTKRVLYRKWDNYANQKNFGISKAKNRWVLSIDADERISRYLKQEIKSLKFDYDGYLIPVKNIFLKRWLKHGGQYPDYHLRLFDRFKGKFELKNRQVHEGISVKSGNTGRLKEFILHYSYKNIADYFEKFNDYTYLDAKGRFKNGIKPSVYGLFLRPIQRFFKWYVMKLGLLDGMPGLVFYMCSSFYVFVSEVKLLERYDFRGLKWRT